MDVADLRSAGFLATAPGGHGTEYAHVIPTVSEPAAAEAFVEAWKASGSDYLKIVLNGSRARRPELLIFRRAPSKALVQAAHARKMLVVAHVESQADVQIALAAGVDVLGHVWRDQGAAPELAQRGGRVSAV